MSDDILSGGAIDSSTSGPIPPSRDDRDRDILLQQKEKQDQDAIGGTQFPPKPQPLPPIPEAIEVAPPLPPVPSFDLNYSGPAFEETREIARQTMVDVLKNVTINGQGPSLEGSTIAFNIPQQPPASEAFFFQGVVMARPIQETLPQPVVENPEIQSVVVAPPSRQIQPATTDKEQPVRPEIPRSVYSEDFGTGGKEGYKPAYEPLSEYPTFDKATEPKPQQPSRLDSEDFGTMGDKNFFQPKYESRFDSEDFGTMGDENFLKPKYGSRLDKEDFGSLKEDRSSAKAYKVTAEEKDERLKKNEQEEGFDRESSIRQRGETQQEFKERQEKLAEERQQKREDQKILEKIRTEGFSETSILPSGMVPVALTRADGQKKILAYLSSEFVGVTEGGEGDERITTLPPEESYYVGGGGAADSHPFQISTSTNEEGNITFTVNVGTLNSLLPNNIFNGPKLRKFPVSSGLQYVVLTGTSDGRQFTSCSLSVANQATKPQKPTVFGLPTTATFLLGVVYGSKVFQVQNTNLLVTGKQQYVKQKTSPAPAGTLPYEIYYIWG